MVGSDRLSTSERTDFSRRKWRARSIEAMGCRRPNIAELTARNTWAHRPGSSAMMRAMSSISQSGCDAF
jgi:hypothetical protein